MAVDEASIVQRNIAQQREWYGEPLGDRVRRLVVAYDVSQANLAEVLGISAPMLSQVMSGRRAKIGNPAVLARLIMLERKVLTPGVAAGEPDALRQALDDVHNSKPAVTMDLMPNRGIDESAALSYLRDLLAPHELHSAAAFMDTRFPELSEVLRKAATED
jgi:transcriptional regulator with XRE-family HTH domain